MDHISLRTAAVLLLWVCVATGCTSATYFGVPGPTYPTAIAHEAQTLDVQVEIFDSYIEFTNTSTSTFQSPRVWLNRWYSASMEEILPGQVVAIPLEAFADEEGRSPRRGGFLASREQEPIVLVEIEHGEVLVGLVVVETADR